MIDKVGYLPADPGGNLIGCHALFCSFFALGSDDPATQLNGRGSTAQQHSHPTASDHGLKHIGGHLGYGQLAGGSRARHSYMDGSVFNPLLDGFLKPLSQPHPQDLLAGG